jgi:hypothetical protein
MPALFPVTFDPFCIVKSLYRKRRRPARRLYIGYSLEKLHNPSPVSPGKRRPEIS